MIKWKVNSFLLECSQYQVGWCHESTLEVCVVMYITVPCCGHVMGGWCLQ